MKTSAPPRRPELISAGVVNFLANNLEQILGRHRANIPDQPQLELRMLLDAIGELRTIPRR